MYISVYIIPVAYCAHSVSTKFVVCTCVLKINYVI